MLSLLLPQQRFYDALFRCYCCFMLLMPPRHFDITAIPYAHHAPRFTPRHAAYAADADSFSPCRDAAAIDAAIITLIMFYAYCHAAADARLTL